MQNRYVNRGASRTVTFDTTTKPTDQLIIKAKDAGWQVSFASVSFREASGTDFELVCELAPELGVWDESAWDAARWADQPSSERLDRILNIISNGSFPTRRSRLTENQLHQLRDAMILEAHSAARTDVFVSADRKGFINHGRREELEQLLRTRILTPDEFLAELNANTN